MSLARFSTRLIQETNPLQALLWKRTQHPNTPPMGGSNGDAKPRKILITGASQDCIRNRVSKVSPGSSERGMIVTLTVVILLSIGLLLLLGPFEMARATWLLSQVETLQRG